MADPSLRARVGISLCCVVFLVAPVVAYLDPGPPLEVHTSAARSSLSAFVPDRYDDAATTTTTAEPAPAPADTRPSPATAPAPKRKAPLSASPAYSSMQPCGGDLPPCDVKKRESGGNYNAYNPTGCDGRGCFGAWQFSEEWAGKLGLPKDLRTATPQQQDDAARTLWNGGAGCANWAAC